MRTPEFNVMSRRPGIAADWLGRWQTDIYPNDYVVVNGFKHTVPRYYDKLLGRGDPLDLADVKEKRELEGSKLPELTPLRLSQMEENRILTTSKFPRPL